jgi:predicted O-linked N-acetylglucosamine transferase (SPINDLY family)
MLIDVLKKAFGTSYAARLVAKGQKLWAQGDLASAAQCLRTAIAKDPQSGPAHSNLGAVLIALHRYDEGFAHLEHSVALAPADDEVLVNFGNALYQSRRTEAAVSHYWRALEANPANIAAHANLWRPLQEICDWPAVDKLMAQLRQDIADGGSAGWLRRISPFSSLFLPFSRREQLEIAGHAAAALRQAPSPPLRQSAPRRTGRLRIGYLSSDFHEHATAYLTAGIYGHHDRDRFEIFAYSLGPAAADAYRQRIVAGCDKFIDVAHLSSEAIAERIAADRIDILLDMKGYTGGGRPGVLAKRPAPIQASYLGYPGTMGADFIDYLIVDEVIAPEAHAADYSETIVRLPGTYQPSDDKPAPASPAGRRQRFGLPESGVVFCCFNITAKIDRRTFAAWMRILAALPDSVLWLLSDSPVAQANLRHAAESAGVGAERLVFAAPVSRAEHLERLAAADIFLDTFTCCAHTLANDAVLAGLPLVTLRGETFASRVASSILTAAGTPELIAGTEGEFIDLAIKLARAPEHLAAIRQHFVGRPPGIFDTKLYVRRLEDAFQEMLADSVAQDARQDARH